MPKKETIVLLVPILAHYRRDVYRYLTNSSKFDFIFCAGNNYENIKKIEELPSHTFDYISLKLFGHQFYYLKGSVRKILQLKTKAVICSGVDFHLIHTLVLFFIYRILLRRKFYWWSHGTSGHQGKLGWLIRKIVYKLSSGIMLYSNSGYQNLLKMKIDPGKLVVLNNCLNNDDYGYLNYDVSQKKEKSNGIKILFTGRISNKVDIELLIKSISYFNTKYKKLICNIVGGGNIELYKKISKKYNVSSQINFIGPLYGNKVHKYFLESNIFVYPGGIGLSILHAFSFGLPVITTDNLAIHNPEIELLNPGINGDYYRDNDFKNLAKIIDKWINILSKNRSKYVSNCLNAIEEFEYLPEKVGGKVLNFLIEDLLNK